MASKHSTRRKGADSINLAPNVIPFPARAQDPTEGMECKRFDLNKLLISRPGSTWGVRVLGETMLDEGISEGDLLIVDRAAKPTSDSIVVVVKDGELLVRTNYRNSRDVWGVVLWIIKPKGAESYEKAQIS